MLTVLTPEQTSATKKPGDRRRPAAAITVLLMTPLLLVNGCGSALTIDVPQEYKSFFVVAARRCPGVLTPQSLAGQAYVESRFNQKAKSPAGAEGIMQIIPEVWKTYGTDANGDGVANPYSAADSIATAAKYDCVLDAGVSSIRGNQTELRLAAYNAGLGAVQKYHGVPPYPETTNYVKQVIRYTAHFAPQFVNTTPSVSATATSAKASSGEDMNRQCGYANP